MSKGPFGVSLDDVEADIEDTPDGGLTDDAKDMIGHTVEKKEEEVMPGRAEAAERAERHELAGTLDVPNLVVSSPKDTWEVLGRIELSFTTDSLDDIKAQIEGCFDLWAALRVDYEEEIAAQAELASRISTAQVGFIKNLCKDLDRDVPEDLVELDKDSASTLITELKKERDSGEPAVRSTRGRSSSRPSRGSGRSGTRSSGRRGRSSRSGRSSGSRRGGGDMTKPMTDKQADLVDDLAGRLGEPEGEPNTEDWTKKDADEYIKAALTELND